MPSARTWWKQTISPIRWRVRPGTQVIDHSGRDFALVLYGSALKLALYGVLVVSVLVPRAGFVGLLAGLGVVCVAVGVVESVMARLRLARVPQLLVGASALALFATILQLQ